MQYYITISEEPNQKLDLKVEDLRSLIHLGILLSKNQDVEI